MHVMVFIRMLPLSQARVATMRVITWTLPFAQTRMAALHVMELTWMPPFPQAWMATLHVMVSIQMLSRTIAPKQPADMTYGRG